MVRLCPTRVLALLAVSWSVPAAAQVGYLWTPQELTAKADVVAVVEVISVQDTGRTHV